MKLSKIFLPLIAATALTGCDSFLDIQPVGKVIPTTADEFRSLITEGYSNVPYDRGLTSFRTDEVLLDATMDANDLSSYLDIWRWNDTSSDENTASFSWRTFYHVLFIANYTIESEKLMTDGSGDEIRQMVGEAYMLRALMHFNLVNLYAPAYTTCTPETTKAVPLKLDSDVESVLSRNTVAEVYKSILDDLDSAEEYLNTDTWETGYNYRFNTLSPDAMRSRVYLYMGKWEESLAASERVIAKHPQLSDINAELPNAYNSVENIVALEQTMQSQYARTIKINRNFYSKFSSTDLRRRAYFKQVTTSNITLVKGGSNTYSCTFRSGEMYLNAAEAAWHLGQYDDARTYTEKIYAVRYTDGGAAKTAAIEATDDTDVLDEILEERARELAFEGHRWFDLRRNGQPRMERSYRGETYVLEQGDARYTLRIPAEAITANPELAA